VIVFTLVIVTIAVIAVVILTVFCAAVTVIIVIVSDVVVGIVIIVMDFDAVVIVVILVVAVVADVVVVIIIACHCCLPCNHHRVERYSRRADWRSECTKKQYTEVEYIAMKTKWFTNNCELRFCLVDVWSLAVYFANAPSQLF
jgi:hypothetical protein